MRIVSVKIGGDLVPGDVFRPGIGAPGHQAGDPAQGVACVLPTACGDLILDVLIDRAPRSVVGPVDDEHQVHELPTQDHIVGRLAGHDSYLRLIRLAVNGVDLGPLRDPTIATLAGQCRVRSSRGAYDPHTLRGTAETRTRGSS